MTNKEAIKFGIETLEYMRDNYPYLDDERKQALNFAIKALEERPQGKWIKHEWGYICSVCNESNDYAYDNNIHKFVDNYCPHCGAKMGGGEEK